MKRLVALLLCILVMISISACTMGTDGTQLNKDTSATEETKAPEVDITKYKKDFDSMQKYLIKMELLSDKKDAKTVMQADIIGAKTGVRYKLDTTNFVEFYELDTKATPDEGQKLYDAISSGKTYKVLGVEELEGVVSGSGKYLMLYPVTSSYDYSNLEKEFKKF
ncbi:MAG: hypothetical protein IKB73_01975 [Ruminococcus sp.]|nr:hypothetical protein [Ruminococcus sp.]